MKKVFIDVETGGTNAKVNPILQLSGEVEIDGVTKEKFNYFIQPFENQVIEDEALDVTGFTREQIRKEFLEPKRVYLMFIEMLNKYIDKFDKKDKSFFVGYNSKFDEEFLREFFINNAETEREKMYGNGYGCYFWTPSVDVMALAIIALAKKRVELENFKLQTVCEYLGYNPKANWHDAQIDIHATKWLFGICYNIIRGK